MNYLKSSSYRLDAQPYSWKTVILYMVIAYIFGIAIRLILLYQMGEIEGMWDGNLPVPIWTPDSGRYGFYAKEILAGVALPLKDDYLLGHLIAMITSLTSVSIDWVMLVLPIMLGSLIVIPIILLGTSIKQPLFGFLSALIAVSGSLYYIRTNLGYMDTDSINFFLILMGIAWIVKSLEHQSLLYATLATLALILFGQWYHSATIINLLLYATAFILLLLFHRRDKIMIQSLILLALVILPIAFGVKILALFVLLLLFILLNKYSTLDYNFYVIIIGVAFFIGLFILQPEHYFNRAIDYLSPARDKVFTGNGIDYHYLNDLNFVGEAQKADIWNTYTVLYVSKLYVIVATVGYILMLIAYPILFMTLPLMILGYLSGVAGVRFTIYATPVLAFGFVYLLYFLGGIITSKHFQYYAKRLHYYGTSLVLLLMVYTVFYANSNAIMGLQFYKWEKNQLKLLGSKMSKEDTMITWWEYGWPLWYYTGKDNTLTDNGYHGGPDSHLVAQMLLSDNQNFVANTAKYLSSYRLPPNSSGNIAVLPIIAQEENLSKLFNSLSEEKTLNKRPQGNVYILLHQGMLSYFGILIEFQNWDMLKNDFVEKFPKYSITPLLKPYSHNSSLLEGYGYILDSSSGEVLDADNNKTKLNTLMLIKDNKRKEAFSFHNESNRYMIVARQQLIWLDKSLYNSFFFQAMFMDVYDKNLFEKVAETKRIKIFKVK